MIASFVAAVTGGITNRFDRIAQDGGDLRDVVEGVCFPSFLPASAGAGFWTAELAPCRSSSAIWARSLLDRRGLQLQRRDRLLTMGRVRHDGAGAVIAEEPGKRGVGSPDHRLEQSPLEQLRQRLRPVAYERGQNRFHRRAEGFGGVGGDGIRAVASAPGRSSSPPDGPGSRPTASLVACDLAWHRRDGLHLLGRLLQFVWWPASSPCPG